MEGTGRELFDTACWLDLEGIVAKKKADPYGLATCLVQDKEPHTHAGGGEKGAVRAELLWYEGRLANCQGQGRSVVVPIQTKIDAKNWLEKRLAQEGPGLWTDQERKELVDQVTRDYRPASGGPEWRVKQWTQRPDGIPVYVVTRGGVVGIHTVDDRENASEKADAIMRALNGLDAEMRSPA